MQSWLFQAQRQLWLWIRHRSRHLRCQGHHLRSLRPVQDRLAFAHPFPGKVRQHKLPNSRQVRVLRSQDHRQPQQLRYCPGPRYSRPEHQRNHQPDRTDVQAVRHPHPSQLHQHPCNQIL